MNRSRALLLFALAGCGGQRPIDAVDIPTPPDGTRAVVVTLERDAPPGGCGTVVGIRAFDLTSAGTPVLPSFDRWDGKSPLRATALYFDRSLVDLGLSDGNLTAAPPGAGSNGLAGTCFPGFSAGWQRSDPAGAWAAIADARSISPCFCLPVEQACADLRVQLVTLVPESDDRTFLALALDAHSVLVTSGVSPNKAFRVREDGNFDELTLEPDAALLGVLPGARPGVLYLGSGGGAILRGHIEGNVIRTSSVARSPRGEPIRWLVGPLAADDSLTVLYTLSLYGTFERYDAATDVWETLDELNEDPATQTIFAGALISLGRDEALAMKAVLRPIMHARGHVSTRETVAESPSAFCAAAMIPPLGVVLGNGRGGFFHNDHGGDPSAWQELPLGDYHLHVRALLPWDDGFMFAGDTGYVGQYLSAPDRFCPAPQLAPDNIDSIARVGASFLVAGTRPTSTPQLTIAVVHPR